MKAISHNAVDRRKRAVPEYTVLGEDVDGYDHVHRSADNTIHVIAPDGERAVHAVDDTPLEDWHEWIPHVEAKLGWGELTVAGAVAGGFGGR